ncbi:type V toxin-antitoxin system endoribonuclease antitoxin GhoS [Burkholderia sp. AU19243]|nr:type V toxin-antitoxin system endoribonuclease antitoxin GhoS [Burkholderia vietnamiensis]MBR8367360.1 type V toxin-antitoxin system endoribonuclease antitoxin GhoS [Burkholderia sp. AU19243]
MNWFITRVELHDATEADYQRLHEEMEARRFFRSIQDQSGTRHQLPTAMYFSQSIELDAGGVRGLAVAAANATGRRSWVITCLTTQWAAQGLPAV